MFIESGLCFNTNDRLRNTHTQNTHKRALQLHYNVDTLRGSNSLYFLVPLCSSHRVSA